MLPSPPRFPRRHQYAGCLIGQALGEALGSGGDPQRPDFGLYGPRTRQARALLESWVKRRRFDPEDLAARLAALPPGGDAAGLAACRAAPVGLLGVGDLSLLVRVAAAQTGAADLRADEATASVLLAAAVRLAVIGPDWSTAPVLEELTQTLAPLHAPAAAALTALRDPLPPPGEPPAIGAVLSALSCALRPAGDLYGESVRAAAAGGPGCAAMAGAIAGARVGTRGLPPPARRVTDGGEWNFWALERLADSAWKRAVKAC